VHLSFLVHDLPPISRPLLYLFGGPSLVDFFSDDLFMPSTFLLFCIPIRGRLAACVFFARFSESATRGFLLPCRSALDRAGALSQTSAQIRLVSFFAFSPQAFFGVFWLSFLFGGLGVWWGPAIYFFSSAPSPTIHLAFFRGLVDRRPSFTHFAAFRTPYQLPPVACRAPPPPERSSRLPS